MFGLIDLSVCWYSIWLALQEITKFRRKLKWISCEFSSKDAAQRKERRNWFPVRLTKDERGGQTVNNYLTFNNSQFPRVSVVMWPCVLETLRRFMRIQENHILQCFDKKRGRQHSQQNSPGVGQKEHTTNNTWKTGKHWFVCTFDH